VCLCDVCVDGERYGLEPCGRVCCQGDAAEDMDGSFSSRALLVLIHSWMCLLSLCDVDMHSNLVLIRLSS
jgi:hypothetical protein